MERIQRPSVAPEDVGGDDYTQFSSVTNQYGVVTPYGVRIPGLQLRRLPMCWSSIAASSNCIIVKTIYIAKSMGPAAGSAAIAANPGAAASHASAAPAPTTLYRSFCISDARDRNPSDRRSQRVMPPPQYAPVLTEPTAPAGPALPVTILREKPLFVTLYLEVYKLKMPEPPAPAAAPRACARDPVEKRGAIMEFLKKHYEKIVLCVVLLGLAGAVLWMKSAIEKARLQVPETSGGPPPRTAPPVPLDLSNDQQALAQITNRPTVVLSGEHNTFNPVTWKRKSNGDLIKVIKTGPDALIVTNFVPRYTIISYVRAAEGPTPVYVFSVQRDLDLNQPNSTKAKTEFVSMTKKKSRLVLLVRGIKGAENEPSEINLEITDTGDTNVWVSTNSPYKHVESHLADLKYDPELLTMLKKKVKDEISLDSEPYIIVEITNNAVRVQSRRTTKVTEIKWTKSPKGD